MTISPEPAPMPALVAASRSSWAERWYNGHPLFALLLPLSVVFALIAWLRRTGYRLGWLRVWQAPVPVIVVGNISVGGTGKTPLTLALVEHLRSQGWRPGIVSRGYGGQGASYPQNVRADSDASQVGDEPLLLARRAAVSVVIDPLRVRGVQHLLASSDCNIVLCDDGLQHHALARTVEIAVIDGQRGLGSGWLLPAGPLRESVSRLQSVALVVVNGAWRAAGSMPASAATMTLIAAAWQPVRADVDATDEAAIAPAAGPIHAVAGIGNPPRFFAMLAEQGFQPIPHAFPDHHAYTADDLQFSPPAPVVMTEKDAVKCAGIAPANSWYVPVQAILPDSFWQALTQRLAPWRTP
ncbi:MAG: tetraacyldisaccharide 4'-kinase [Pseudomonadota bacterium]